MDLEEAEYKICQYCQLWKLYAETSVELKRKTRLSSENAVTACKVYRQYISDVLQQVNKVMKLFTMERELRLINIRGHFPVPKITPQGTKIENNNSIDNVLEAEDVKETEMIKAVRESEENYEREQEEARNKEKQMRLSRQANRSDFNFLTMNSSTPIRNNKTAPHTRTNQLKQAETAVHFDPNTIRHFYPPTNPTSHSD